MRYTYNLEYLSIFSKNNEIVTSERQKVISINYSIFSNVIRFLGFSSGQSTIFVNDHKYSTEISRYKYNPYYFLSMTDSSDIYQAKISRYTLDCNIQGPNSIGEMKQHGFLSNYLYKSNIGNINFEKPLPFLRGYEITMTDSQQLEIMAFCAWIIQIINSTKS